MKDVIHELEKQRAELDMVINSLKEKQKGICEHKKTWRWNGETICLNCEQIMELLEID
jgi:hypothetical protein